MAASASIVRDHNLQLLHAFVEHAKVHPRADVHAGLCALVLHVQGDPLDGEDRKLVRRLVRNAFTDVGASLRKEAAPRVVNRGRRPAKARKKTHR